MRRRAGLAVAVTLAGAADLPVAPPPRQVSVRELVGRLDHPSFEVRERATFALGSLAVPAPPPELVEAASSPNPEVSRRASAALARLRRRIADAEVGYPRVLARWGAIDRFVDGALAWDVPEKDQRLWQEVVDVGAVAHRLAGRRWTTVNGNAAPTLANFWVVAPNPHFARTTEPFRLSNPRPPELPGLTQPGGYRVGRLTGSILLHSLVIAADGVRTDNMITESVVLSNGPVECANSLNRTVVVCDADVTVRGQLFDAVVIARGDITVEKTASQCTLIAGGKVRAGKVDTSPRHRADVREGETTPFGWIRFFTPAVCGFDLADVAGRPTVARVTTKSPAEEAGFRAGDEIARVEGSAVTTVESVRRALRASIATRQMCDVTVRRGGRMEALRLALPDDIGMSVGR